jgi:hypothetical protein
MLSASIVVGVVETVVGYYMIAQRGFPDPDNYMRIVRIRDGLQSGGFTHLVSSDNGGAGTIVYWSHLIDAFVLFLRAPFGLIWNSETALYYAAAATAPLVGAVFAAALIWSVAPLAHVRWLITAPLLAVLSPLIFISGMLGSVHHHLALALIAVLSAAFAGRAAAGRVAPGVWCGVCSGIGIWLSPEVLPYVLMAIGAIGVAWCLRPAKIAYPFTACATAFAGMTTVAALIDPPFGGRLSPEVDCISIVFVTLSIFVCAAAWILTIIGRHEPSAALRILYCICAIAAVIGVWLWLYPNLTHGLGGLAPGYDVSAFFSVIGQMKPIRFDVQGSLFLMTGLFGVLAAIGLAFSTKNLLWSYAAACGIIVLGLAISHLRFAIYAEAMAAMMLPVVLEHASASRLTPARQSMVRIAVMISFFLGPYLPAIAAGKDANTPDLLANCHVRDIIPVLQEKKDVVLLTEINDTPEILWRTSVRTVGSLYHRSLGAFLQARKAWRSEPSDTIPQSVLATGATHILACDLNSRSPLVIDLPPTTLQDRLARHDVPPWLHEIGKGGGYRLYAIDQQFR